MEELLLYSSAEILIEEKQVNYYFWGIRSGNERKGKVAGDKSWDKWGTTILIQCFIKKDERVWMYKTDEMICDVTSATSALDPSTSRNLRGELSQIPTGREG